MRGSTSGCVTGPKFVTGNGFSDTDFTQNTDIIATRRCAVSTIAAPGFTPALNAVISKLNSARPFLPGRDYVTFGSLLSQIRVSVVSKLVHPTQGVKTFSRRQTIRNQNTQRRFCFCDFNLD